jgi:hypothetical protein
MLINPKDDKLAASSADDCKCSRQRPGANCRYVCSLNQSQLDTVIELANQEAAGIARIAIEVGDDDSAETFSPNGRQLISGEHDHSVRLYTRHRTLWGFKLD